MPYKHIECLSFMRGNTKWLPNDDSTITEACTCVCMSYILMQISIALGMCYMRTILHYLILDMKFENKVCK